MILLQALAFFAITAPYPAMGQSAKPTSSSPIQVLENGPLRIEYRPRPGGMRCVYRGVEIFKSSELIVTTPPWAPHYYVGPSVESVATATQSSVDDSPQVTIRHVSATLGFEGTETIAIVDNHTIEQTLSGHLMGDVSKALVQWRVGAWNPSVIVGRPYSATCAQETSGTVPVAAIEKGQPECMFLDNVKRLTIDSRVGQIQIEVESVASLTFQDYRTSRWANPTDPYFWFGDLSSTIRAEDGGPANPIHYRIRYSFAGGDSSQKEQEKIAGTVGVHKVSDAQIGIANDPPIVTPQPKEIEFRKGYVVFDDMTAVRSPPDSQQPSAVETGGALSLLLSDWRSRLATNKPGRVDVSKSHSAESPTIEFKTASDDSAIAAEGYILEVSSNGISIESRDATGFRHAVQTIKQLSHVDANGSIAVRHCSVRDWPSLKFRGVHLFTGGGGTALHKMLFDRILAGLKLNSLVFEAEYVEWDSHPETHHPKYGMPKSQVRELLEDCKRLGIEVIPLVQSLGHCQWIFENGANLDIAEDPEAKWAYCVTNPRTYAFIFEVYAEAIELFKPKTFHIGHDEYADRGRVPFREESKKHSVESLFVQDTLKLRAWFKKQNIRVMMWGDMLLAKGEGPDACHAKSKDVAETMRLQIPKDIIISDWHYADDAPEAFVNLDVFEEAGFETIAATWNRPGNIKNFAHAAYRAKSNGLLQTTWAGYSLDDASFQKNMPQYLAYVLAAESAWNADRISSMDFLDAGQRFFNLCDMTSLKPAWRTGWTTDLGPVGNHALQAADASGWFGLGTKHDLSTVPKGPLRLGGLRFDISETAEKSCIALQGQLSRELNLPSVATLRIDAAADTLALIVACEFASPQDTVVGRITVAFANGKNATRDLVYGSNVFATTDLTPAPDAPVVWRGQTAGGSSICLRALMWDLGSQEQTIRSITIESSNAPSSLVLLGLTGLRASQ